MGIRKAQESRISSHFACKEFFGQDDMTPNHLVYGLRQTPLASLSNATEFQNCWQTKLGKVCKRTAGNAGILICIDV